MFRKAWYNSIGIGPIVRQLNTRGGSSIFYSDSVRELLVQKSFSGKLDMSLSVFPMRSMSAAARIFRCIP